jgi:hypothetical protein
MCTVECGGYMKFVTLEEAVNHTRQAVKDKENKEREPVKPINC